MQTKQQKRASFALKKIESLLENEKIKSELATFIVGMPTMILSNGLGQTLAFLLSKDDSGKHKIVFQIIKEWLQGEFSELKTDSKSDIDFLKKFNSITQQRYLKAQHETLRLLEWLKRYARAFSDKTKSED